MAPTVAFALGLVCKSAKGRCRLAATRLSLVLLLALLSVGCGSGSQARRLDHSSEVAWGETAAGLQAGLRVEGLDENDANVVLLRVYLRNVSNTPLTVHSAAGNVRLRFDCMLVTSQKYVHKYAGPIPEVMLVMAEDFRVLQVDEVDAHVVRLDLTNFKLAAPVKAEVAWLYDWQVEQHTSMDHKAGKPIITRDIWKGSLRSGICEFAL